MIKTVDVKTLKTWLANKEAVLIDVREPQEYAEANIPDSKLIPLGTFNKALLPDFTNKKLVIHCRSGKRSAAACELLLKDDPNIEVYNSEGGILAWQ